MDHAAIHYNASTVAIKFFVGEGGPRHDEAMQDEQNGHKDIIALDGVSDAYADLTIKVRHALQWVSTNSRALYVAKVDDDTYVNVDRLLTTLLTHPPESLYFGFSMYKQGVVRAGSKNSEPTGEGFLPDSMPSTYPPYMSGGGYVLGYDVVDIVAYPRVQPVKMLNEDAYLGIVLLQYNVNRVSTMEIFPNGIKGCKTGEQILMIHYVKVCNLDLSFCLQCYVQSPKRTPGSQPLLVTCSFRKQPTAPPNCVRIVIIIAGSKLELPRHVTYAAAQHS